IDSVSAATMWTLVWTVAVSWVLWGIALLGLSHALLQTVTASVAAHIAAWAGAFLAGLIVVFAPAGLGAREGVMQAVLTRSGMPAADALVVAVVSRVWVTALDVVPAVILLAIRRRRYNTSV
ncbi:MAG TPA: hypothetical protein VE967_10105, partial [Gemmatimonadaceae bacterium]|nr:hypothetical protein [Gemmatimonadaceae bacterium]